HAEEKAVSVTRVTNRKAHGACTVGSEFKKDGTLKPNTLDLRLPGRRVLGVSAAGPGQLPPHRLAQPCGASVSTDTKLVRPRRRISLVLSLPDHRPRRIPDAVLQRRVRRAVRRAQSRERSVDA